MGSDTAQRQSFTQSRAFPKREHTWPIRCWDLAWSNVPAVQSIEGKSARQILGTPDDLKLKSCATLFSKISQAGSVFEELLGKYFDGEGDSKTLQLIQSQL